MTKHLIVIMGVSGCGKSTLAVKLADHLSCPMIEADDFHSEEAKSKMASGIGLSETDREPWLARVARACETQLNNSENVVAACSALKKGHRNVFRKINAKITFLWLNTPVEVIRQRLMNRKGHFATSTLLASQFATLEPPESESDCASINNQLSFDEQFSECLEVIDGYK